MTNAPADDIASAIRQYIRNERDRYILYRHLIDGATYDQIADEMSDDPGRIPTGNSICKRCLKAQKLIAPYL